MKVPRFGIKSLPSGVAIVALWLSTITGYGGANEVRAFIILSMLVSSGVAAIHYDGRRQAFLVGFFITVFTVGTNGPPKFGSRYNRKLTRRQKVG